MNSERIVITGVGVVSPNGVGRDRYFEAIASGRSGVRHITHFDASSLPCLPQIRVPTVIITAQDDSFIPFVSFRHQDIETNPNIVLLAPEQGGHVGFVSADREGEERFWAEVMAVEFVKLLSS